MHIRTIWITNLILPFCTTDDCFKSKHGICQCLDLNQSISIILDPCLNLNQSTSRWKFELGKLSHYIFFPNGTFNFLCYSQQKMTSAVYERDKENLGLIIQTVYHFIRSFEVHKNLVAKVKVQKPYNCFLCNQELQTLLSTFRRKLKDQ